MTFKEKVTAKEQYQVFKETWEKKSLELTTENLDKVPPIKEGSPAAQVCYSISEEGIVPLGYIKDFQQPLILAPFEGFPNLPISIEELNAEGVTRFIPGSELKGIEDLCENLSREEILEKFGVTPDPEYKEPGKGDEEPDSFVKALESLK